MNDPENSGKPFSPEMRSAARLAAVQALYEINISGAEPDPVLHDFLSRRWPQTLEGEDETSSELVEMDRQFFSDIVRGAHASQSGMDEMINGALDGNWTVERIEVLLKSILSAGVYELANFPDVPKDVIINEYVDVAKAFYTEGEPKMVNGVLDKLGRLLRS